MRIFIYLVVLLFPYCQQLGMQARRPPVRPSRLVSLAQQVARQRAKLIDTQYKLVHAWCKTPPRNALNPEHINAVISALAHQQIVPKLQPHEKTLEKSIRHFNSTPGFLPTLHRLFGYAVGDPNNFKGSLYEIEQALAIHENNYDEIVLAFNQRISCPRGLVRKEFDICTNWRLIECKNIKWSSSPTHSHHLRAQFEQQNKITQSLKDQQENDLVFHICSKEKIPDNWRIWFAERGIAHSS